MPHIKSKSQPKPSRHLPFGFTLIELVVVITILAILGTIGFLSIWGYSSKARDSARIWDTAQISKSLDVSIVTRGTYPTPDNAFSVTYSGGVVWNQGVVSSGVMQSMKTSIAGGGLNKKPVDPLSNAEYVYSSLAYGKAYQLKVNYEGDLNQTAYDISTPEAQAAPGNPTIAYIRGNYGGLMAKTVTGSITYVLAVPSIITSTGSIGAVLSITDGSLSGSLLFHGKPLKSASSYNPSTVVFSGAQLPTSDTSGAISTMMNNLKTAYSWATDIASVQNIATLLSTTTTGSLVSLGSSVISGQLEGSSVSGGSTNTSTNDTTAPTITSVTAAQSACNTIRFTVNGASDAGGLATSAYSFDGGSTWQAGAFRDFSGTSYTVNANLVRVRDVNGNVYVHASGVSGTATGCPVNCVGSWSNNSTCSASCGGGVLQQTYTITTPATNGGAACPAANGAVQWGGTSCNTQACAVNCSYTTYQWSSCSASCGGGNYDLYYTKTVVESGGGSCPISQGQFAGYGGSSCNTQACPTATYGWVTFLDYGNTYVGGSNPWSMTYYGACGTCSAGNVNATCSQSWQLWWPSDPDCANRYCGLPQRCTQTS